MSVFNFVPGAWREPIYPADFLVEVWRFQSVGRDDDARFLLAGIWSSAMDAAADDRNVRLWFRLRDRVGFVTDDQAAWDALPTELNVYRAESDPTAARGLAWTVDPEVAEHLAGQKGLALTSGRVAKADVLAFITHRGEDEILVPREAVSVHS